MIIVDNALKRRAEQNRPIRVGMIGAGFMGQGLTNQIVNSVPGMQMTAVQNRNIERALQVYDAPREQFLLIPSIPSQLCERGRFFDLEIFLQTV